MLWKVIKISIKFSDIINFMEEIAPIQLAESWDNAGVIVGSQDAIIEKVMVCLDVTSKVVKDAVERKVDLIISHHPFIFKGLKSINLDTPQGNAIHCIIANGISVYSAHTNYDYAPKGVNHQLAEKLELNEIRPLVESINSCQGCGLGRV
jgi:dinuclear metal center YbgI/SA1388 family protein